MRKFILIFVFAALVFLAHFFFSGQAIYGDGIDYWAYLPTIYFDHDLDFRNQFTHIHSPQNNNLVDPKHSPEIQKTPYTVTKKTDNTHTPGNAIIWLPSFIAADAISALFNLPRNGYANIYQITAGLWSIAILTLGLYLNYKVVKKIIKDEKISFQVTLLIFFATPLLYYGSYDVLNSHFAAFTLTSLFWYLLFNYQGSIKIKIIIGLIIGMATLVRLQEALLIIPLLFFFYLKNKPVRNIILPTLVFILTISPLFLIWTYLHNVPLPINYMGSVQYRNLLGSIFDPINGLIRTPLLPLSFIGLNAFFKKEKLFAKLMGLYFILQFIVITVQGGWVAPAYGARMYISSLPFFSVMLSFVLKKIKMKYNFQTVKLIVIIFSIINIVSISSFVLFEKEVNSGKKRGLEEHTQEKVEKIINNILPDF